MCFISSLCILKVAGVIRSIGVLFSCIHVIISIAQKSTKHARNSEKKIIVKTVQLFQFPMNSNAKKL